MSGEQQLGESGRAGVAHCSPLTAHRRAEGQTSRARRCLARYASFVKLPHTVFALPFALVGVLAASLRGTR